MRLAAVAFALLAMLFTSLAIAQESDGMPPLPRPRPDREGDQAATSALGPDGQPTPATDAITALTSVPQPVHLTAQVTEGGTNIAAGLVWRIFDTRTDNTGELALVAKSDEADAQLTLPPGEYVVHVAYGSAQASDSLTVAVGDNDKTLVLDAGAMRLTAAIAGDIPIPPELMHFDIFTGGVSESDRRLVAENLAPNDMVTLNAGTYHVVAYFGDVNAMVRADLRVEPGQLTDATLYHHAAVVNFKLASEAGGEAIADVEWTVKTSDGETVFSELGAFPTTVLAEGTYLVLAKRGDQVFNREFEVLPGAARDIDVLTDVYAAPTAPG
ncbi:MAG: hypothetical protein JWR75_1206 [Devosia sp.]|nr:hypothetical protein [Devosia sp.]